MKRSTLTRKTALRSRSKLARTGELKRRKPMRGARPKPTDDPARLRKVRQLPCAALALVPGHRCHPHRGHRPIIIAHHSLTHRRGQKKSLDRYAMPLEWWCHGDLHTLTGGFKGWTKADRRDFEVRAVAWTDEQLAAMEGAGDGHGARRTGGMR